MKIRHLSLPVRNYYDTDWLMTPGNMEALEAVKQWAVGKGPSHMVVVSACSKTFAALLAAKISHASVWDGALPPLGEQAVIIDNADHIHQSESFFHWYNEVVAQKVAVLYTAATPPALWPHTLPDLLSRLRTLPIVRIADWSDSELEMLLPRMMRAQGLYISPSNTHFVLQHLERSFVSLRLLVDYAHHHSASRNITKTFLKDYLRTVS